MKYIIKQTRERTLKEYPSNTIHFVTVLKICDSLREAYDECIALINKTQEKFEDKLVETCTEEFNEIIDDAKLCKKPDDKYYEYMTIGMVSTEDEYKVQEWYYDIQELDDSEE